MLLDVALSGDKSIWGLYKLANHIISLYEFDVIQLKLVGFTSNVTVGLIFNW